MASCRRRPSCPLRTWLRDRPGSSIPRRRKHGRTLCCAPSGPQADDGGASAKELEVEAELQEMIAEHLAAGLLATTAAEGEDDDAGDQVTIAPVVP